MALISQIEGVENLLKITDITIPGILVVIIGILYLNNRKLSSRVEERERYIREQDRSTLQILGEITHAVERNTDQDRDVEETVNAIKDRVVDIGHNVKNNNQALNGLAMLIQEKLLKMN